MLMMLSQISGTSSIMGSMLEGKAETKFYALDLQIQIIERQQVLLLDVAKSLLLWSQIVRSSFFYIGQELMMMTVSSQLNKASACTIMNAMTTTTYRQRKRVGSIPRMWWTMSFLYWHLISGTVKSPQLALLENSYLHSCHKDLL